MPGARGLVAKKKYDDFNLEMEIALGAIALYGLEEASEHLYAERDIECSPEQLERYQRRYIHRFREIQTELAPQIEAIAVSGLRDGVARLNAPIALGVQTAHQAMQDGRVNPVDAAKISREFADIQAKQNNTMLVLQERPTIVRKEQSTEEIIRKLEAKGVISRPELELPEAEVVEEATGKEA